MSDILASSSIDSRIHSTPLPTTAPYSSEGPTLPIVSAAGATTEHDPNVAANSKKRKRPTNDSTSAPNKAVATEANHHQQPPRTNHPSLYEPWTLLPAKERKALEARGTERVLALVYTKNQNVKSGIAKVLRCLGAAGQAETEGKEHESAVLNEEGVLAVSAQGEGTVKVVGIVEMVGKIVGKGAQGKGGIGEEGDGKRTKWYVYTVLSSVVVARGRDARGAARDDADVAQEGDAMDVDVNEDGEDDAMNETQDSGVKEGPTKSVPVLTVWMTRKRIQAFKDAFGEQELVVVQPGAIAV